MKKKGLITGALILTGANIVTRILGFIYRIYMSNHIGAEGMGLYQLIMPIYTLCWSISASGFSTTVSKLVAQENAKKEYGNMGRILKQSFFITAFIGTVIAICLFTFTDWVGVNLLKDGRTILALKVLSFCFPFMAAGSCIRGYFYGIQYSTIPALSQVLEQVIRMLVIYLSAQTLIPMGLEYACVAAVSGICIGEIISFLYVVIAYKKFKKSNHLVKKPNINSLVLVSSILSMAIPLTANRVVNSILSTIENTLIPQKLIEHGYNSTQAMSAYGEITGMAMPLLQFPTAFLVALSITLVPAVSEAVAIKNPRKVTYTVSKTLQFTALIGIGVTSIFLAFPQQMSMAIYKSKEVGTILSYMAWMSPFLYLNIILSGILNGLGEQVFIFKNNMLSSIINIIFIYFYIPQFGMIAFIIGATIGAAATSFLAVNKVLECTSINFEVINWLIKPILAITSSTLFVKYIADKYIFNSLPLFIALLLVLFILGIAYIVLLFLLRSINKDDVKMLLGGIKK